MKKEKLLKLRENLLKSKNMEEKERANNRLKIVSLLEENLTEEEIEKYNRVMAIDGDPFKKFNELEIKRAILRTYSTYFTDEEYKLYYEKICSGDNKKTRKI